MVKHLSSEELESVMAGHGTENAVRHARECVACAEELADVRSMLGGMRETAMRTADRQRLLAKIPAKSGGWVRGGVWAGVMAAVMVAVVVPVEMRQHREPAPVTAQVTPQTAGAAGAAMRSDDAMRSDEAMLSDDALLSGVQNDLSKDVPAPMEPLAGTSTTTTNTNAGNTKE